MIEVILREDIHTLGRAGEMVRVKPGYARNYLLPQGLAYEATEGNRKRIAAETRVRTARNESERTEAERMAGTLSGVTLTLTGKAGEEGKLFGSITSRGAIFPGKGNDLHSLRRVRQRNSLPFRNVRSSHLKRTFGLLQLCARSGPS